MPNILSVRLGFHHIIASEAATFLEPHQTLLSSYITEIKYDDHSVNVKLESNRILKARFGLREAIDTMKMGTYAKIFMKWDKKFWDESEMGIYADPYKRGYYPVWQSMDHEKFFPGSGIYFTTVTGDESERIENMPDEMVLDEVMGVLNNMYPNITVPRPTHMHFHRWNKDKLTRGSFANWPAGFYVEHQDNLRAPVKKLYFAGEATSFQYYGYLQGAYTEGKEVGKAIAKCMKTGDCPGKGRDLINKNELVPAWYKVDAKLDK